MNHLPSTSVSPNELLTLYAQTAALMVQLEHMMQAAGAAQPVRQAAPDWTAAQANWLVFNPAKLLAAPRYAAWINQRGGLREVYRRLLLLPLRHELRLLLEACVSHPGKTNLFYADHLYIERSTLYYRKNRLAAALQEFINAGELDQPLQ